MKLVIMGEPGAGKGTQAKFIARKFMIEHISTGEILREAIRAGISMGQEAKGYIDSGKLVPDKIMIQLVLERLKDDDCKNGFILDGFPRTLIQAMEFHHYHKIDMVLDLAIDPDVLIKRITGRRSCPTCGSVFHNETNPPLNEGECDECDSSLIQRRDDTEEIFRERLKVYHEEIEQLIKYYNDMDLLTQIDGSGTINEIQHAIEEIINEKIID